MDGSNSSTGPAVILLVDPPDTTAIPLMDALVRDLSSYVSQVVGMEVPVSWTALPALGHRHWRVNEVVDHHTDQVAAHLHAYRGHQAVYLIPVSFDFGLPHKQWLTELVRGCQRACPELSVYYDEMNPAHPLVVQALTDTAVRTLQSADIRSPAEVGVMLVAAGAGDASTRASSYQVMRLLWEQLGVQRGEVAFVRHVSLALPEQLMAGGRSGLRWLCIPQFLWSSEIALYMKTIFSDCVAQMGASQLLLAELPSEHPNLRAWLGQRILSLHRGQRAKQTRERSPKYRASPAAKIYGPDGHTQSLPPEEPTSNPTQIDTTAQLQGALIAELSQAQELAPLLSHLGVCHPRTIIKPTWHGYATGTYTDPSALSTLLSALPAEAIVVEGHTSSRNRSPDGEGDWEDGRALRAFITAEDQEFLQRTGLLDTLRTHKANYVNVTEAYWDSQCVPREVVESWLKERGVALKHPELMTYVPKVLFEQRGNAMLSFARFKGPTRLATSNLFGLLPPPLRTAWHGPNITYFAQVCCDLAKLYGSLFDLYGIVESLHVAVRWDRDGLYRSRWGNYDLIPRPGVVCLSRGVAAADVLAARLQGQDVTRSAFFDVVRAQLGFDEQLTTVALPDALVQRFV